MFCEDSYACRVCMPLIDVSDRRDDRCWKCDLDGRIHVGFPRVPKLDHVEPICNGMFYDRIFVGYGDYREYAIWNSGLTDDYVGCRPAWVSAVVRAGTQGFGNE